MNIKWQRDHGWQDSKAVWTEQHVSLKSYCWHFPLLWTGCVTAASEQGAVGSSVRNSLQSKAGREEEILCVFLPK